MIRQATIFVILALAAGYIFADAYEFVPGVFTVRPAEAEAVDYPQLKSDANAGEQAPSSAASVADAPMPEVDDVQRILDEFASDPKKVAGNVSALVIDAVSGEVLGNINADVARIPASNMKMPTAYAALDILGPDTTFATTVRLDGDTIYIVGGGDVLLAPPDVAQVSAYGAASITDLATQTAEALTAKSITKVHVKVDSTLFEGPLRQEGVLDSNRQYVMEARPLGTKEQDNTEIFGDNPDIRVAELMAPILTDKGVTIESVARAEAPTPETATEIARTESATVHSLVDYMLTRSDNSTAETLAHLIAIKQGKPATFEGGAQAISEYYRDKGFNMDGLVFADASGLSEQNRLTARFLVDIHDRVRLDHGTPAAGVASGLPVGGYNGTINNRFREDDMGGLVHAKTGSLVGVRSLSGYLQTKKGRLLEFAIMVDEIPKTVTVTEEGENGQVTEKEAPAPDPRAAMDEALTKIAAL